MKRRTGFAKLGYANRVCSNPDIHEKAGPLRIRFQEPVPLSEEQRAERERGLRNEALLRQASACKESPFSQEAEDN